MQQPTGGRKSHLSRMRPEIKRAHQEAEHYHQRGGTVLRYDKGTAAKHTSPPPSSAAILASSQAAATRMLAAAAGQDPASPAGPHGGARSDSPNGGPLGPYSFHGHACAIGAVAVIALLVVLSMGAIVFWARGVRDDAVVCSTPGCQTFAAALMRSMRLDEQPCVDFSKYVCGAYSGPHNMSVREAAYETFKQDLVRPSRNESIVTVVAKNMLQKAWAFYRSCEEVAEGNVDNILSVTLMLKEARLDWPDRNEVADAVFSITFLQEHLAWPAPIQFVVKEIGPEVVEIVFSPSDSLQKYKNVRSSRLTNRKRHAEFFSALASAFGNTSTPAEGFEATMLLEDEHLRGLGGQPNTTVTVDHTFSDNWHRVAEHWGTTLREVAANVVKGHPQIRFATTNKAELERLHEQIAANESNLVLMLGWRAAQEVSRYANRDFALLYYSYGDRPLDSFLRHCFDLFSGLMGLASITHYVAAHFDKETRSDVAGMARAIRLAYFQTLTQSTYDWSNTSRLFEFLDGSQSSDLNSQFILMPDIGRSFPDDLRKVQVFLLDNPDFAERILAHRLSAKLYESSLYHRRIDSQTGLVAYSLLPMALNFPFYEPDVPLSIRYGALGSSVAVLTAQAFYTAGGSTELPRAAEKFRKCVSINIGKEHVEEVAGMEAAYKAFLSQRSSEPDKQLAGLVSVRSQQMFYVAAMYRHCGSYYQRKGHEVLRVQRHFSEAFSCPEGSAMHAKEFCELFQ